MRRPDEVASCATGGPESGYSLPSNFMRTVWLRPGNVMTWPACRTVRYRFPGAAKFHIGGLPCALEAGGSRDAFQQHPVIEVLPVGAGSGNRVCERLAVGRYFPDGIHRDLIVALVGDCPGVRILHGDRHGIAKVREMVQAVGKNLVGVLVLFELPVILGDFCIWMRWRLVYSLRDSVSTYR